MVLLADCIVNELATRIRYCHSQSRSSWQAVLSMIPCGLHDIDWGSEYATALRKHFSPLPHPSHRECDRTTQYPCVPFSFSFTDSSRNFVSCGDSSFKKQFSIERQNYPGIALFLLHFPPLLVQKTCAAKLQPSWRVGRSHFPSL